MTARHAEIAGAGFAGLSLAILLRKEGWTVRVHERSPQVREIGAGIFIHNNGLLVLEEMGLMDEVGGLGTHLKRDRMLDERGRFLQDRELTGVSRVWSVPREHLIQALLTEALESGAEVVTDSRVIGADEAGALIAENGRYPCDLAVAADGHRSSVRDSLGLTLSHRSLPTASIRFLVPTRSLTPEPYTTEHWSGRRRIALAASGPDNTYIYMAAPESDESGGRVPIDAESWSRHFPKLTDVFSRLLEEEPYRASYSMVKCSAWSKGAVALVGDAAHGLPPTLGQGTNLTLANARSLTAFLRREADIERALKQWERQVRPVTDATQRWARYYDWATGRWPRSLRWVRKGVIRTFGTVPQLNSQLRRADAASPVTK